MCLLLTFNFIYVSRQKAWYELKSIENQTVFPSLQQTPSLSYQTDKIQEN